MGSPLGTPRTAVPPIAAGASPSAGSISGCSGGAAAGRVRVRRIVKLGGSAVTVKSTMETLRREVLDSAARSLAASLPQDGHSDTIVVHGAGSFGHFQAAEYGVVRGPITDPRVRRGLTLTRASVKKLNNLVVDALIDAGAPACGISPFGHYTTSNRQIARTGAGVVEETLQAGLLPVLHGDSVLDEQLGCTVLSGDTLIRDLAQRFKPQYVVFLTDVAGVYDRPPSEPEAKLLTQIIVQPDGSWRAEGVESVTMSSSAHDTTGGIALKVEEAAAIARMGIPVVIAQAGTANGDMACRLGHQVLLSGDGAPSGARPGADPVAAGARHAGDWQGTVVLQLQA